MDCNGHGSHVAGTAAGFGVNSDGTTYTGGYGPSTPFSSLRVGPGTAPEALLYALRVFGCGGGTGLTIQAIDWAMDPNGDSDFADHLDVINMSLGSDFGQPDNALVLAADAAARAGIVVVASAGNSGDTFLITGSPASAGRAISVAASADPEIPGAKVQVNAPAAIAGPYAADIADFGPAAPSGGLTGNVVQALDPANSAGPLTTDGCSALTNAAAIAGNIALIDRGTCTFPVKTKNAQNAGAIGMILVNSSTGASGTLGGTDATITIPTVMISFADGNTFKTNIATLNATLFGLSAEDTLASFSSRGPRDAASPILLKPDIAAPGINITSAQTGVTCTSSTVGCLTPDASGFIPGSQSLLLSGTSMASPHMAGIMALLRQIHPTWTVEQLKALAMNGALHDLTLIPKGEGLRYGPSRIGAGRVDPVNSAKASVLAYNAEDPGQVSISFETAQVISSTTETRKLRVVNTGASAATFDLGIDTVVDAPGIAFSLPDGNSITIPADSTVEIPVQMAADASQMDHTREATVAATQPAPSPLAGLGSLSRHWLTEESGYVTFSQSGTLKLRVPVHLTSRPAATMSAPDTIVTSGAPTGATTIPLSGDDVCTGTLGSGPTCTGSFPNDEVSLVTPVRTASGEPTGCDCCAVLCRSAVCRCGLQCSVEPAYVRGVHMGQLGQSDRRSVQYLYRHQQ